MEGKLRVINNVNIKMENILQFVKVFFNVRVKKVVCRLKMDREIGRCGSSFILKGVEIINLIKEWKSMQLILL